MVEGGQSSSMLDGKSLWGVVVNKLLYKLCINGLRLRAFSIDNSLYKCFFKKSVFVFKFPY